MPTGYTATLCEKGQSFQDYALTCARAFGALVMMRDDAQDAAIPQRFEPSDYNTKAVLKARAELVRLNKMKPVERMAFGRARQKEAVASEQAWLVRDQATNARLHVMRRKVEAWNPPSSDHTGLKEFMLEQIETSMNDTSYITKRIAKEKSKLPADYYAEALATAERDVAYHTDEHRKEVERTEGRNLWLQQLRESVKEETSVPI